MWKDLQVIMSSQKKKNKVQDSFFLMQEGEWNKNTFSYLHKEILEV